MPYRAIVSFISPPFDLFDSLNSRPLFQGRQFTKTRSSSCETGSRAIRIPWRLRRGTRTGGGAGISVKPRHRTTEPPRRRMRRPEMENRSATGARSASNAPRRSRESHRFRSWGFPTSRESYRTGQGSPEAPSASCSPHSRLALPIRDPHGAHPHQLAVGLLAADVVVARRPLLGGRVLPDEIDDRG